MARVIGTLALSGDTQAPTQPQNLQATAINRQRVDLSWTASTDNVGVTGYQVFRDGSPLDTSETTTYSDTTADDSTTYTYVVTAFDAAGNSSVPSASAQATTPANASPVWQTVADQTLIVGDSYSLNLNDVCDDADADTIVYSIISGTLPSGLALAGANISGTPTTAGQTPTVGVRAFDGFVNVDTTIDFATFTEDATAPPVPTGLAVNATSSSAISVTWNASTDVAGTANEFVSGTQDYRVYRSTDGTNFSLRTTVTGTSYSDTGLAASTTYHYTVTARDAQLNESAQSDAVATATEASGAGSADWDVRSIGPAVLFSHDFDSSAEVDNFRFVGGTGTLKNHPGSDLQYVATGGVDGGGFMRITVPIGETANAQWFRPLSPIVAGTNANGKTTADLGASGTIAPRNWNALSTSQYNWTQSIYTHPDLATANTDGNEFYVQMAVRFSASRANPSNPRGKLLYIDIPNGGRQEIVTRSQSTMRFDMYTNFGSANNSFLWEPQAGTGAGATSQQPGSEYAAPPTYWDFPLDEWVYVQWRVKPGRRGNNVGQEGVAVPIGTDPTVMNTELEVWVARLTDTAYTRIWRKTNYVMSYNDAIAGFNMIKFSGYMNGNPAAETFTQDCDKLIVSQEFIPCPSSASVAPSYVAAMTLNRWYALSGPSPSAELGLTPTNTVANVMGSLAPFASTASDIDTPWNDWTGFAIATQYGTSGALGCNGGGHQGSDWPGWYFWDFATRTWAKDAASAPGTTTITNGLYSNGAPPPTHTTWHPHTRSLTGEVVLCISETTPGTPSSKRVAFRKFDPATHTWSGGAVHTSGGGNSNGGCAVYDPALDRSVFAWGSEKWYRDWTTGTEAAFTYPAMNDDCPGIFLPANGVRSASYMLLLRDGITPRPFAFINTASPTSATRIQATPSGLHADHNTTCCVFFSPGNDALYVTGATPSGLMSIVRYNAPSTIPGTWTGVEVSPTAETTIQNWLDEPQATQASNVRGKARLMVFSNGMEVLYLSGWPTHPVYGIRIR